MNIRAITIGFVLFLIASVIIANTGNSEHFWPFIHKIQHADKASHIILFGTLSFLCNLTFPSRRFGRRPFLVTLTTLVLLLVISLEEISQAFIPIRHCDLFDWLAGLAGLAIGQIAALRCTRRLDHETAS